MSNPRVLLVHGSMQGAWAWDKMVRELAQLGMESEAFDLPGHGDDLTPRRVITMAHYIRAIVERIDRSPSPVVLVGHSMAGYPITIAARQRPDRIRHLVYFSAQARAEGQTWADTLDPDVRSRYEACAAASTDGSYIVPEEIVNSRWLSSLSTDCALSQSIRARLTPQPIAPLFEPAVSGDSVTTTPVTYIWPTEDRQNTERRMRMSLANLPPTTDLVRIGGDHCAMMTNPKESAAALQKVIGQSRALPAD